MAKNKNLYHFVAWAGRLEKTVQQKIVDLYESDSGWIVRFEGRNHENVPPSVIVDRLCLALYSNAAVIAQARYNARGVTADLARQDRQDLHTQAEINRLIAEQRRDAARAQRGR